MDRLLGIMTGMSLALIAMVLFDVRRAHIRVEYSVTWLSAAVFVLVLSRSRWALDQLAAVLGIGYPPLAIVILAAFAFPPRAVRTGEQRPQEYKTSRIQR